MIDDCGGKGELEKQIWLLSRENDCEAYDVGCDKVDVDEIIKIVGEMRKEFPTFRKPINPTIATIDALAFKALATKWCDKWLGDSK